MLPPLTQLRVSSIGSVKRKREPDGANDELGLPDPYPVVSVDGAQWLWRYMRRLEETYVNDDTDYTSGLVSVDESAKYWDARYRNKQETKLEHQYRDFFQRLTAKQLAANGWDSEIETIKSYTGDSGHFNRYLASNDQKDLYPDSIKEEVHRLYKLLARCPRLEEQAVFLRSVRNPRSLPHNRHFAEAQHPMIGRAYLNVSFLSTTIAEPDAFVDDALTTFFSQKLMCCMYVVTAPAGLPILPLAVAGPNFNTDEAEAEVILPPGLLLVYQGERVLIAGEDEQEATVHFYQAVVPPMLDPLVETL